MPTTITKTLKKDGSGDYTTFDAFIAAEAKNLVTADELLQLDITGAGWDDITPFQQSGQMDFNAFTTDATRKIVLNVLEADRHNYTDTTGFILESSVNVTFVLRSKNVDIVGFHCREIQGDLYFQEVNVNLIGNLIHDVSGSIECTGVGTFNLFYNLPFSGGNNGIPFQSSNSVSNNTVILQGGAGGFNGDIALRNILSTNNLVYKENARISLDAYFGNSGASDYNAVNRTGEGLGSQTNSLENLATSDFEDYANDDFRIKASSVFATAGLAGTFMGAVVASASGITVTGTAVPTQTEVDIVTGGKTIILTLAGDTFVTGTSSEDGIAGGSDSDITASGTNWDSLIKTALDNTDVVLSVGDTVATITLPAFGTYDIPSTETITWTIPAASLTTGTSDIIATPTHTITAVVSGVSIPVIMNQLRIQGIV